jgi:hypothetical protein
MYPDPMWLYVSCLLDRARRRVVTACRADPEFGALSLEWIVIAGLLVAAAVAASLFFRQAIEHWESKMFSG